MDAVTTVDGVPALTLGWAALEWGLEYVRQPDGPAVGSPLVLTDEQVRFILWWYAVNDRGRFVHHRGQLRRSKGWGKSPIAAFINVVELCGPCRFDGFDADGGPVAVPVGTPWVQLAAVSERQTLNTMAMVLGMVAESPVVDDYQLDVGKTRILRPGGGRLEPVTASAQSAEGGRPSHVSATETQWWFASNGGHKLDQVNRRNLGKIAGGQARLLEDTNAHAVGDDSVAERTYRAWRDEMDRSGTSGILVDSREAPATFDFDDDDELRDALRCSYGDSTWVDLDRVIAEIRDPSTSETEARRFYLNQITTSSDRWWNADDLDALVCDDRLADGDMVTLGFDGSEGGPGGKAGPADSTALVAVRLEDGLTELVGVWEHTDPRFPWSPPRDEVTARVDELHERFTVVRAYGDPRGWETDIDRWHSKHGVWKAWPTYRAGPMTDAIDRCETDLRADDLRLSDDPTLLRHLKSTTCEVRQAGQRVFKKLGKPSIWDKVDAAVTVVLAVEARGDAIAAGEHVRKRGGRAFFFQ